MGNGGVVPSEDSELLARKSPLTVAELDDRFDFWEEKILKFIDHDAFKPRMLRFRSYYRKNKEKLPIQEFEFIERIAQMLDFMVRTPVDRPGFTLLPRDRWKVFLELCVEKNVKQFAENGGGVDVEEASKKIQKFFRDCYPKKRFDKLSIYQDDFDVPFTEVFFKSICCRNEEKAEGLLVMFMVGMIFTLIIPIFWVGFLILLLAIVYQICVVKSFDPEIIGLTVFALIWIIVDTVIVFTVVTTVLCIAYAVVTKNDL